MKLAKQHLEEQNEELKTLDKMKDGLVRDVSHELKTPIVKHYMVLEMLISTLRKHGLLEECRDVVTIMESSIKRQEGVISNILDLARLEAGGRKFRLEMIRLDELLNDVLDEYDIILKADGIKVIKKIETVTIYSDKEMLFHVFSNLIGNAVKYRSTTSTPKIEVILGQLDGTAQIKVVDNGVGLTVEEIERVFDRFYQASLAAEGSGVGLTISEMIIKELDGNIRIESGGKNKGTTVIIELPLPDDPWAANGI